MLFQWDRLQPGRGRYGHHRFRGVASDAFLSRTGFSRERAGLDTVDFLGVTSDGFPAKAGPIGISPTGPAGPVLSAKTGPTGLPLSPM